MKNATILTLLVLLSSACNMPLTAIPAPTATRTVAPAIPSETATFTLTPTLTAPSRTPEPSITPTLGFLFFLPTYTPTVGPTPGGPFACALLYQSVVDETEFKPREYFEPGWKVVNTGTSPWLPANVDFAYFAGTKMHKYTPVPLTVSVEPGQTANLTAEMGAPGVEGTYKAIWSLRRGTDYFCRVSVVITVVP